VEAVDLADVGLLVPIAAVVPDALLANVI